MIFKTYLQLKSVHTLVRYLNVRCIRSKARTTRAGKSIGGRALGRGAIYHLLRNRLYLGEVPHRDQSHPGLHTAIVKTELFEVVQARLDADDQPMSPTFAYGRHGRLYRYYVSVPLQQGAERKPDDEAPRRVPAAKLTLPSDDQRLACK